MPGQLQPGSDGEQSREQLPWRPEEHDCLGNSPLFHPPLGLYPEVMQSSCGSPAHHWLVRWGQPLVGDGGDGTGLSLLPSFPSPPPGRALALGTSLQAPTRWCKGGGEAKLHSLSLSLHTPPQAVPALGPGQEAGRKWGAQGPEAWAGSGVPYGCAPAPEESGDSAETVDGHSPSLNGTADGERAHLIAASPWVLGMV